LVGVRREQDFGLFTAEAQRALREEILIKEIFWLCCVISANSAYSAVKDLSGFRDFTAEGAEDAEVKAKAKSVYLIRNRPKMLKEIAQ
jgi:hypothetical protein